MMQYPFGQVGYNSGSLGPLLDATTYYVYCDDPHHRGGAQTYLFSTKESDLFATEGRVYIGRITTPGIGNHDSQHRNSQADANGHSLNKGTVDTAAPTDQFVIEPDYSVIRFAGQSLVPTKNQRAIIKTLHEQLKHGITRVPKDLLKKAMGNGAGEVKDSFKRSPFWRTLVVPNAKPKGTYSLNLSVCLSKSSTDDSPTAPQPRKDPAKTQQRPR